ncbi:MAG: NTP transferase domain-containing protein [Bilophila sp.]
MSLLREHAEAVFVSSRAPQDAPFPVIPDMVERMGPFGGLYSVLHRLNGPLLVLSCDLPFMDRETLVRLLAARRDRERGTIMTTFQQAETGFIEALVAVYDPPACRGSRWPGIAASARSAT